MILATFELCVRQLAMKNANIHVPEFLVIFADYSREVCKGFYFHMAAAIKQYQHGWKRQLEHTRPETLDLQTERRNRNITKTSACAAQATIACEKESLGASEEKALSKRAKRVLNARKASTTREFWCKQLFVKTGRDWMDLNRYVDNWRPLTSWEMPWAPQELGRNSEHNDSEKSCGGNSESIKISFPLVPFSPPALHLPFLLPLQRPWGQLPCACHEAVESYRSPPLNLVTPFANNIQGII